MRKKSMFSQIVLLIVLSLVCILLTVIVTLSLGSVNTTLFDFQNLNLANMIPVLIIGGFVSCVIIGIAVLFISRSVFYKIKEYISKENGGQSK